MKDTRKRSVFTLGAVAAASIVAGMLIASKFDLTGTSVADPVPVDQVKMSEASAAGPGSRLFVEIAKRDTPAVVNISTTQFIKQRRPSSRRRQPRALVCIAPVVPCCSPLPPSCWSRSATPRPTH